MVHGMHVFACLNDMMHGPFVSCQKFWCYSMPLLFIRVFRIWQWAFVMANKELVYVSPLSSYTFKRIYNNSHTFGFTCTFVCLRLPCERITCCSFPCTTGYFTTPTSCTSPRIFRTWKIRASWKRRSWKRQLLRRVARKRVVVKRKEARRRERRKNDSLLSLPLPTTFTLMYRKPSITTFRT